MRPLVFGNGAQASSGFESEARRSDSGARGDRGQYGWTQIICGWLITHPSEGKLLKTMYIPKLIVNMSRTYSRKESMVANRKK